jgi:mRNA-degrading endonuclease HigB of HigAB toxin-antitoxin module
LSGLCRSGGQRSGEAFEWLEKLSPASRSSLVLAYSKRAVFVFNIMGKNYRLIARIDYGLQAVTLKHFLPHAEYDRGRWKKDC